VVIARLHQRLRPDRAGGDHEADDGQHQQAQQDGTERCVGDEHAEHERRRANDLGPVQGGEARQQQDGNDEQDGAGTHGSLLELRTILCSWRGSGVSGGPVSLCEACGKLPRFATSPTPECRKS
jgi:hypothetical protein